MWVLLHVRNAMPIRTVGIVNAECTARGSRLAALDHCPVASKLGGQSALENWRACGARVDGTDLGIGQVPARSAHALHREFRTYVGHSLGLKC